VFRERGGFVWLDAHPLLIGSWPGWRTVLRVGVVSLALLVSGFGMTAVASPFPPMTEKLWVRVL